MQSHNMSHSSYLIHSAITGGGRQGQTVNQAPPPNKNETVPLIGPKEYYACNSGRSVSYAFL